MADDEQNRLVRGDAGQRTFRNRGGTSGAADKDYGHWKIIDGGRSEPPNLPGRKHFWFFIDANGRSHNCCEPVKVDDPLPELVLRDIDRTSVGANGRAAGSAVREFQFVHRNRMPFGALVADNMLGVRIPLQ